MDITPLIPSGRQVIESYGDGRFRISGTYHQGSVIVTPEASLPWPVADFSELTPESLQPLLALDYRPGILLVGCGKSIRPLPESLRAALRAEGMVLEPMDSGAACRTYNVLMSEERLVAAALIAIE